MSDRVHYYCVPLLHEGQGLKAKTSLLQDVDAHLKHIDEQQNIDMALVMGAPTSRPTQTADQMNIPNRPSMRLGRMRTISREMAAVGSRVSISRQTSLQSNSQTVHLSSKHLLCLLERLLGLI